MHILHKDPVIIEVEKPKGYCVLALHYGANERHNFLAVDGKIVVFDTLYQAQSMVKRMGAGRAAYWDIPKEHAEYIRKVRTGYNAITIWKDYDVYNVPVGFAGKQIYSEAQFMPWKRHVHMQEVWKQLCDFADANSAELYRPMVAHTEADIMAAIG